MALMAGGPQLKTQEDELWIKDSGARWHMTGKKDYI